MLLLENYFFFAPEFCNCIIKFFKSFTAKKFFYNIQGYIINDKNKIGNLMGAIHGISFTGFIGEVYKIFPFPKDMKDFKQKPDGYKNREIIEKIIVKYANSIEIPFETNESGEIIQIAEFQFTKKQFFHLINYVLQGGYPRWKDEKIPDYVKDMKEFIEKSDNFTDFDY